MGLGRVGDMGGPYGFVPAVAKAPEALFVWDRWRADRADDWRVRGLRAAVEAFRDLLCSTN